MRFIPVVISLIGLVTVSPAKELLYLGHTTEVNVLKKSGNYLLSSDVYKNWTLWDFEKKVPLIHGKSNTGNGEITGDLRKNTLVIMQTNSFLLYNLPDTNAMTVVTDEMSMVHVSTDGAYIWSASYKTLKIWDRRGNIRLILTGDYSSAQVAIDSTRLFITNKGQDSLLVYPADTFRNPQTVRFVGGFGCWMVDGSTFLSTQGGIVRVYGIDGSSRGLFDIGDIVGLDGYGTVFWTVTNYPATLKIYEMASGNVPVYIKQMKSTARVIKCESGYLGLLPDYQDTLVICKFGAKPEIYNHCKMSFSLSGFDVESTGRFVAGNRDGLIVSGKADDTSTFNFFNDGMIRCIHGTTNGKVAVSTSSGKILTFDMSTGSGVALDTLLHTASSIKLSSDGTKIFAMSYNGGYEPAAPTISLTVFSHPSNEILSRREYLNNDTGYILPDVNISADGSRFGTVTGTRISNQYNFTMQSVITSLSTQSEIRIPRGVVADGGTPSLSTTGRYAAIQSDSIVKIYKGDTLINAFGGKLGGWFDDSTLIINRYRFQNSRGGAMLYWHSTGIYRVGGDTLSGYNCTEVMDNVCMISDSIAFYGPGEKAHSTLPGPSIYYTAPGYSKYRIAKVVNIRSGAVIKTIFDSTQAHGTAFPVGPDLIVYQTQTALEWVNWHEPTPVVQPSRVRKSGASSNMRLLVAGNRITIDLVLDEKTSPQLSLFTLKGELLGRINLGQLAAGSHHLEIPSSKFAMVKRPGKTLFLSVLKAGAATVAKRVIW